jgi:hypothetical protein
MGGWGAGPPCWAAGRSAGSRSRRDGSERSAGRAETGLAGSGPRQPIEGGRQFGSIGGDFGRALVRR